jgi:hypothetical protein
LDMPMRIVNDGHPIKLGTAPEVATRCLPPVCRSRAVVRPPTSRVGRHALRPAARPRVYFFDIVTSPTGGAAMSLMVAVVTARVIENR